MSLVELARFASAHEAELARGRLEYNGIHAVCFDAGMNIGEGVGFLIPVRLMILAEDRDEALAILGDALS
jgi:Putative prokaryotic signal transducing protein